MEIKMRSLKNHGMIILFSTLLASCSAFAPTPDEDWMICHDPRPQICTMEYMPVCGQTKAGELKTYASGCTACAEKMVEKYRKKACE